MLKQIYGAFFILSVASPTQAQVSQTKSPSTLYPFTKGLMALTGSRYGREAIYTDPLAYQLYTNTLKQPVVGAQFGTDERGQPINWVPVTADSLNRLRLRNNFRGNGGAPAGPGVTPGTIRGGIGGGSGYAYLTYPSTRVQVAVLTIKGNSHVYVNGEPHMGDAYSMGYMHIPVRLRKGLNEFYVRGTTITASLEFPQKTALLRTDDPTLPSIRLKEQNTALQGAIVIINASDSPLSGLQLKSNLSGREVTTSLPTVPAMSTRKVAFAFDGSSVKTKGAHRCGLTLLQKGKSLDSSSVAIDAVETGASYNITFTSHIDGSLQYYAVTPSSSAATGPAALFLSVHGAGVEASGQSRAYKPKDWGTLVAATNRRPRGFNWEDWGRLDALEVLALATDRFKPDARQTYLTGHSMGGHGTWFLGATYPDKWAAIAPCAGYPTLKEYGSADGLIPDSSSNPLEQVLLQAGNQSDVLKLVSNYKPLGVYVFHGDADRTVPVTYARQMRKLLGDSQPDMSYYEYPGGSHWFGDHSVDWKPLFDFFKWHQLPIDSTINTIDFTTANPGISSAYRWASIEQQTRPLAYSRIQLSRTKNAITGTTTNVEVLKLALTNFGANTPVNIILDGLPAIEHKTASANDTLLLRREKDRWRPVPKLSATAKGPHRNGTFKDAFTHNMIFVYGTSGNAAENEWAYNKARYDAETWYYRGNGAVDIVADNAFDPTRYRDRGVILFGNQTTNRAWGKLLANCPIQVTRGSLSIGHERYTGDGLGAYFIWPRFDSHTASVGVITGTGLLGMKAANANQYFAGGSGFPDFMVFDIDMVKEGAKGVKTAGFFDNNWSLPGQGVLKQ